MATFAIGDIQGCFDEFQTLLEKIQFGSQDQLWLAGDLVNRGPSSLETLRFIKNLGSQAQVVLGNHDLHLLAVAHYPEKINSSDTLDSILLAEDREELLNWLRFCPLIHHDKEKNFVLVHAGIPAIWTLEEAMSYAQELETIIQSERSSDYFKYMYGDTPSIWSADLEEWDRLRVIGNYLTRMCFCTREGQLDLKTKGGSEAAPESYAPWYDFISQATSQPPIIFGHWASLKGNANNTNVIAIDTDCVRGGELTAVRLEDRKKFSVKSAKYF